MEVRDILDLLFGVVGVFGVIASIVFYYREKLGAKDLAAERRSLDELRKVFHWQLQTVHHSCNRVENIMQDPQRPDKAVCEVARCIRDLADAMMGQLLGEVSVFPFGNVPIIDPKTRAEIGRLIDTYPHYSKDYELEYPIVHRPGYLREEKHLQKPQDTTTGAKSS